MVSKVSATVILGYSPYVLKCRTPSCWHCYSITHGLAGSFAADFMKGPPDTPTIHLQRRAKRLNHINSSFLAQEEDTRNAELLPGIPWFWLLFLAGLF